MSERQFEEVLDSYKSNLVEYKVSGNTSRKTVADSLKKWLDDYIRSAQANAENSAKEIQSFVSNYAKSDEEMARLKKELSTIRKEGPELQTIYETEREAQQTPPVDYTLYYIKGAVLAGVGGLIAAANMF
jgi:hypothetical protein